MYVYTYIYRERDLNIYICVCVCVYIYIYIHSRSEKSRPRSINKRRNFRGIWEQRGGLHGSELAGTGLRLQREKQ